MTSLACLGVDVARLRESLPLERVVLGYVSGSFSAGFHNDSSDVDVYLIAEDAALDQRDDLSGWNGRQLFIDGRRVDVTCWTLARWKEISVRVHDGDPLRVDAQDLSAYHRASVGQPLSNETRFFELRSDLFDPLVLSRLLVARQGARRDAALLDLRAFAWLGWWQEARDAATRALAAEMARHAANRGENYPNDKWAYEKLYRIYGREHPIVDAFKEMALEAVHLRDERGVDAWCARCVGGPSASTGLALTIEADEASFLVSVAREHWIVAGAHAFAVESSSASLFRELREARSVRWTLSRAVDVQADLRALRSCDCVRVSAVVDSEGLVAPPASVRSPSGADATFRVPPAADAAALVRSRVLGWWAFVDYQSYVDDFMGALAARQYEAALVAAQRRLFEALRLWFAEKSHTLLSAEHAWARRAHCTALDEPTLEGLVLALPTVPEAAAKVLERWDEACAKVVGDGVPAIPGNIREEQGHAELFRYGAAWLETAERLGLRVEIPSLMAKKAASLRIGSAIC